MYEGHYSFFKILVTSCHFYLQTSLHMEEKKTTVQMLSTFNRLKIAFMSKQQFYNLLIILVQKIPFSYIIIITVIVTTIKPRYTSHY